MQQLRTYVETLVIGGGQAGLAVGYYLAKRTADFLIVDAHPRIGDAWRSRWDSLRLFTPARYHALPGMPFTGSPDAFPTKDQMADYLEAYAKRLHCPSRRACESIAYPSAGATLWPRQASGASRPTMWS